jgi:hypothetical protein
LTPQELKELLDDPSKIEAAYNRVSVPEED